jgi:hypothetical protein
MYKQRSIDYRRQSREESDFDDEEEENITRPLYRQSMNYATFNSNHQPMQEIDHY